MTISELSDSALSEWIAEKLEPKPRWTCGSTTDGLAYTVNPFKDLALTPRDFINDPDMTVMLLERLFDEVDTPELREICREDRWIAKMRNLYHRIYKSLDCDVSLKALLGRAVAESWALANGWKP